MAGQSACKAEAKHHMWQTPEGPQELRPAEVSGPVGRRQWEGRTPVEGIPGQGGVSKGAEEGMCRAYSRTKDQVSALVRGWEGPLRSEAAR